MAFVIFGFPGDLEDSIGDEIDDGFFVSLFDVSNIALTGDALPEGIIIEDIIANRQWRFVGTIGDDAWGSSPYFIEVTFTKLFGGDVEVRSFVWDIDMGTITEEVHTVLNAHAGIQAIVGNGDSPETYRIYNMVAPQKPTYPLMVTQKISSTRTPTLSDAGGSGTENQHVRITCYAKSISEAEALSAQVLLAIKNATTFTYVHLSEFDQYDNDSKLYQITTDYSIWITH